MNSLTELFEKHPVAMLVAVGVVVLLALRSGNSSSSAGGVTFGGGGEIAPHIDPNVANVMTAETNAAQQNFSNLASLLAHESEVNAQETLGLAQTSAALEAARISASMQASIAGSQAAVERDAIAAQERIAANNASTDRAIARAADNTQIANTLINDTVGVVKKLFSWL